MRTHPSFPAYPTEPPASKANILLVDDHPANLMALEAILDNLGHNLVKAGSGEEALHRLRDQDFAVVLLDVRMVGLDGFETARIMRSRPRSRHTPIIFLTAHDDNRLTLEEAYALGAVDYLVKPLVPIILRAKVTGFVELFQKTEQVQRQAEQLRQLERQEIEQQSETRFRQLADAMPQIVWTALPDGRIDYYNRQWYVFTGFAESEHDKDWQSILHAEDLAACVSRWGECVRTGSAFEMELRLKDIKAENYRWFLARSVPIRDEAGQVIRWYGTSTDIDKQKRGEQAARFLAEASATLATLVDYESTFQKVARLAVPHFADWCAVDIAEADGSLRRLAVAHVDPSKVKLAHELARRYPPDPDASHGALHVFRTGRPEFMDSIPDALLVEGAKDEDHLRILRELGLKSYLAVPLKVRGKTRGVLSFVADQSGRRYQPDDLVLAEDLARRAGITLENAQLYSEIREADRRKDEFLAMLAHELRNPLAPIMNSMQVMRMRGLNDPQLEWARDVTERQVQQMTRLVDDLLDISRITRGKVELRKETVELTAIVSCAVETSRPLIEERQHELIVSLPPEPIQLEADPTRLAQILANLLNNSAKYTEPQGHIWLTAHREGHVVVLRVRDDGLGISAELLPRIFDLFVQANHGKDRAKGGLGIGLSLVRNLVEMHGGTITAHSEGPGKGSEFVVRLPLPSGEWRVASDEPEDLSSLATRHSPLATKRRILVIDDNVDAADSLAVLLRLDGHQVRVAHDGRAALEAIAAEAPELVFLDIGLPGMDGYEIARRIREQPDGKHMVLVALTGWGQEEDRRRSKEAGFDHHFVKPVEPAAVQQLLAR
jgi:PAS domain S-box-containing protein